ncbi:hypothetical protein EJB05_58017 [Eragrostis curvula]|uniref:F-box domain-containing protein n=1 Tax=Eragrostis curvula TaxID=38414 RepID=A0A5J9SDF1_9POAL|nr:hypothetical protein EJB05_58017 [Eragrostis curvula]
MHMEEISGVVALPDDALADALRRLPLQSLAVARCVCKAWRDIVDARALLIPHLLPRSVHGIFINYLDHWQPHLFLARPSTPSTIDGMLSFLPSEVDRCMSVLDHCNGLLLCNITGRSLRVCNPATRQWTRLPWRKEASHFDDSYAHLYPRRSAGAYLAFDPAVSPHYQVFLIPVVPEKPTPPDPFGYEEVERRALRWREELANPFCLDWFFESPEDTLLAPEEETAGDQEDLSADEEDKNDPTRLMEWPPSPWTLSVFSSKTGQWEERDFVRQGDPAGLVKHVRMCNSELSCWDGPRRRYSVYWKGALYVHCQGAFVARIPLSTTDKYKIIIVPANVKGGNPYLGRSKEGVCFGIVHNGELHVWILNESHGQMEWALKCRHDLFKQARYIRSFLRHGEQMDGPWRVEEGRNIGSDKTVESDTGDDCPPVEAAGSGDEESDNSQSDSDDDDVWDSDTSDFLSDEDLDVLEEEEDECRGYTFDILGFHPYEEVVFLANSFGAAAYHLNSSKIEYLGNLQPKSYRSPPRGRHESFVYTPCIIGVHHGDGPFGGLSKESA